MRDRWINLCLDLNSFVRKCFTKENKQTNAQMAAAIARKSGDIGALTKPITSEQPSPALTEKSLLTNAFKSLEVVTIEGVFRLRKIFSQATAIPHDATEFSEGIGKVQQIPKGLDFLSSVSKFNQVLTVEMFISVSKMGSTIEDSMMVTGIKVSGFSQKANPNVTASSGVGQKSSKLSESKYSVKKRVERDDSGEPYSDSKKNNGFPYPTFIKTDGYSNEKVFRPSDANHGVTVVD